MRLAPLAKRTSESTRDTPCSQDIGMRACPRFPLPNEHPQSAENPNGLYRDENQSTQWVDHHIQQACQRYKHNSDGKNVRPRSAAHNLDQQDWRKKQSRVDQQESNLSTLKENRHGTKQLASGERCEHKEGQYFGFQRHSKQNRVRTRLFTSSRPGCRRGNGRRLPG